MESDRRSRITAIVAGLGGAGSGPARSADELAPLVYEQLRRLARRYLGRERPGHTLQPTEVVHEAYLRLVDQSRVDWQGRTHFFAVGARLMRRILVDHARRRRQQKRGGGAERVTLSEAPAQKEMDLEELLTVDAALEKLAALDERQARVVELRFFAGLSVDEIAHLLDVSRRTVEGDWTHARAWLRAELSRRPPA